MIGTRRNGRAGNYGKSPGCCRFTGHFFDTSGKFGTLRGQKQLA
jgi:hypothetical protein